MKQYFAVGGLMMALSSPSVLAAEFTVSIQNLTQGLYFTPLLVAAHDSSTHLFRPGTSASTALQTMAEGGDISGLSNAVHNAGGQSIANPAGGLLAPGKSVSTGILNTHETTNTHLSVVAMMLPTNDGFIGLNAYEIPTAPGTYTMNINAYDAGTEANNELMNTATGGAPGTAGIPGAPGGDTGTGGTGSAGADTNTTVHIHRGTLGDTDLTGGSSDLDSRVHRWLNPVARITVTVN